MALPNDLCADLAFFNGKVFTFDAEDSIVQAVSTRNGRIFRVGSDDYVRESTGSRTRIVDLDGKTMLPGLIDSHMHPGGSWGAYLVRGVACGPHFNSVEEMLEAVKERVKSTLPGNWILGYSMDDVKMGRYPTKGGVG